ncbi:MAG: hypothetical protein ACW99R_14035 [Candidatus Hodarchaeales archaeon]|jgi:hypothetical protein
MQAIVNSEITELHSFFQKWFNGEIHQSNLIFQRLTTVLHSKFVLISPNGMKKHRKEVIQEIWDAYGSRDLKSNPIKLWIENYEYHGEFGSIYIVMYEEWLKNNSDKKGRVSTAIFEKATNNYNNLSWLYVHETWLE